MANQGEVNILMRLKDEATKNLANFTTGLNQAVELAQKVGNALVGLGQKITDLAVQASKFEEVQRAFENLASSQGKNAKEMLDAMSEASAGTITQMELMQQANSALLLGLPVERFDDMLKIARSSAKATGQSMDFMLNSIVTGLGRGSKLMLDNLGILVDVEKANNDYAFSLGKTAEQLTDTEKKQAFINSALEAGLENLENLGPIQESSADKWARFKAQVEDASIVIGNLLLPAFTKVIDNLSAMVGWFLKITSQNFIDEFFTALAFALVDAEANFKKFINVIASVPGAIATAAKAIGKALTLDFEGAAQEREKFVKKVAKRNAEIEAERIKNVADIERKQMFDLNKERQELEEERIDLTKKAEIKRIKDLQKAEREKAQQLAKEAAEDEEKRKRREEKDLENIAKQRRETAQKLKDAEFEDIDEMHRAKLANLQEIADNEKASQIEREEALLELDRLQIEMLNRRRQKEKENTAQIAAFTQTALSSGLEGVTSKAVGALTDVFLPGFGGAASAAFDILAQDSDQFLETLTSLFDTKFLKNVTENLIALVEMLPELISQTIDFIVDNLPELTKRLIEALVANLPELISAFSQALITLFANPKFQAELGTAIAKGFAVGVKEAATDLKNAIAKAFKDAARELSNVGIGGGGGSGQGTVERTIGVNIPGLKFAHGGFVPRMANGGLVDNTLAALTPGEFVVNRGSAQANAALLQEINRSNGRAVGGGTTVNITVNGGLLGDDTTAREFARAIDEQLYKLRLGRESRAFDQGIT